MVTRFNSLISPLLPIKSKQVVLTLAQVIVIGVFLYIGLGISTAIPLIRGRDELAHFHFTRFIARYHRLPLTWEEREKADYKSGWPPLFHLLVGMAGSNIDLDSPPFIETRLTGNNPRAQLVFGPDEVKYALALATEDPYQSEVLLWYLGRWMAVVSGALGIVVVYLLVRAFYPDHLWLALSAAALLAFIPGYIRNSSVISYDPLLGLALGIYFLLLHYTIKNPSQNWYYFGLGLIIGIAALTKYTPLPLLVVIPVVIFLLAYQERRKCRVIVYRLVLFSSGLAITFGSWLLYIGVYFNRIVELGWISGLLYTFLASEFMVDDPAMLRLSSMLTGGQLGGSGQPRGDATILQWAWALLLDICKSQWLAWMILCLLTLALVGLGLRWWRSDQKKMRLWIVILSIHIILLLILPFVRFLLSGHIDSNIIAGQQVIFPVGAALTLFLIQGLSVWLNPPRLSVIFAVLAGFALWQDVNFLDRLNPSPLPIQSVPVSENEKALVTFDEKIALIGYDHEIEDETLNTTLYWRAEAFLEQDYLVELNLVDLDGNFQARWLGHPLFGRYPTRAWMPGDRIRDTINMPIAGLPSADYQIQIRLRDESAFIPPQGISEADFSQISITANSVNLGLANLSPQSSWVNEIKLNGQKINYSLWHPNPKQKDVPIFPERSTIIFSTKELLGDEVRLSLIGPDDQAHKALDHTGHTYVFLVSPQFASGEYRLRFEKWEDTNLIDQARTENLLEIQTHQRQFEVGPIAHLVEANFAGQVALLGYNLPQNRIQAGDKLSITLYWQALKTMGADFIFFNHLINENQEVWGGKDRRVRGVYSTFLWVPDEIVTDPFEVKVDPDAPDGIYYLLVGLYLPVGENAVSLPLMQNGQFTDVTNVKIGPIKVGKTPSEFILSTADPQVVLNQPFGETPDLALLGYDLTDELGQPVNINQPLTNYPQSLHLTLYWHVEATLSHNYTTFVHLIDENGEIVAQKDQLPLDGAYPTSLWETGEIIADKIVIPIQNNLKPGQYRLDIGLYDFDSGARLTIPGNPENSLTINTQ